MQKKRGSSVLQGIKDALDHKKHTKGHQSHGVEHDDERHIGHCAVVGSKLAGKGHGNSNHTHAGQHHKHPNTGEGCFYV